MPKQITNEELDSLFRDVTAFPGDASVEEIARRLADTMPRRTLQRWLALLVAQKRLVLEGAGRGSRYREAVPLYRMVPNPVPRGASTRSLDDGASAMLLREDPPE